MKRKLFKKKLIFMHDFILLSFFLTYQKQDCSASSLLIT